MHKPVLRFAAALLGIVGFHLHLAAADVAPLRALLITGGCCHDYAAQKGILKQGIEARANVHIDIIYSDDSSTHPPLPIYGNADYAKGYDVIIHDECAADINDPEVIKAVLAPHRAGIPGVNLHCAVHCYRIGDPADKATAGSERALWFDYLGLQSSGHGPQLPITVTFTAPENPILKGLSGWTTTNEEHYNNVQIFPTATPLAHGKQSVNGKVNDWVDIWVNDYHGARVFTTTLGHNNSTVSDTRYLDLVTRGLLWACGKLDDQGNIAPGYGPQK